MTSNRVGPLKPTVQLTNQTNRSVQLIFFFFYTTLKQRRFGRYIGCLKVWKLETLAASILPLQQLPACRFAYPRCALPATLRRHPPATVIGQQRAALKAGESLPSSTRCWKSTKLLVVVNRQSRCWKAAPTDTPLCHWYPSGPLCC